MFTTRSLLALGVLNLALAGVATADSETHWKPAPDLTVSDVESSIPPASGPHHTRRNPGELMARLIIFFQNYTRTRLTQEGSPCASLVTLQQPI